MSRQGDSNYRGGRDQQPRGHRGRRHHGHRQHQQGQFHQHKHYGRHGHHEHRDHHEHYGHHGHRGHHGHGFGRDFGPRHGCRPRYNQDGEIIQSSFKEERVEMKVERPNREIVKEQKVLERVKIRPEDYAIKQKQFEVRNVENKEERILEAEMNELELDDSYQRRYKNRERRQRRQPFVRDPDYQKRKEEREQQKKEKREFKMQKKEERNQNKNQNNNQRRQPLEKQLVKPQNVPAKVQEVKEESSKRQIPESLLCPIAQEVMEDPMMIIVCGHTFEKDVIEAWLKKNSSCPLCKKEADMTKLQRNFALKNIISEYK